MSINEKNGIVVIVVKLSAKHCRMKKRQHCWKVWFRSHIYTTHNLVKRNEKLSSLPVSEILISSINVGQQGQHRKLKNCKTILKSEASIKKKEWMTNENLKLMGEDNSEIIIDNNVVNYTKLLYQKLKEQKKHYFVSKLKIA